MTDSTCLTSKYCSILHILQHKSYIIFKRLQGGKKYNCATYWLLGTEVHKVGHFVFFIEIPLLFHRLKSHCLYLMFFERAVVVKTN